MPTMADIARRSGVSLSTVSYVLSGKRAISDATRRRVLDVMAELAYEPHALGRALANRRTRTIALLFPQRSLGLSEMSLEFVISAAEVAGERGYAFSLSTAPADDQDILKLLQRGMVDGVILMEVKLDDSRVELLRAHGVPFALIGHREENDGVSFVDLDFEHAVREAVAHLAALGHRRVALINGPAGLLEVGYGPSVRSARGFARAVAELGLVGGAACCEATPEAAAELVRRFLAAEPPTRALVVVDREALGGIVQAVADANLAIPVDLSIVAIASERLVRLFTPALTTVDFPVAAMGRIGAELLIGQLEGEVREPVHALLRGTLTVRQSTGPPRIGG